MYSGNVRIGIFSPLETVAKRAESIGATDDLEIQVHPQVLDDAIPVATAMEKEGVEVIISRRATVQLLRRVLTIPVLSFPKRSIDILIALKEAASIGRNILVPMYDTPMTGLAIVGEMLGINIEQGIFYGKQTLEEIISQAAASAVDVVVGGRQSCRFAKKYHIPYVETKNLEGDIDATIENAISAALSNRKQQMIAREYLSIINATSDCIIASDSNGCISRINEPAQQKLGLAAEKVVGRRVGEVLPNCPRGHRLPVNAPYSDLLGSIDDEKFIFNHTPIVLNEEVIGTVTTFRNISNVQRSEHVVRRSLSKGLVAKYHLDDMVSASSAMAEIIALSRQYALTDSTVLIMGATGTGKEILAHGIHNASGRSAKPFVSLNCAAIPEQLLESELFGYEHGSFTGSRKGGKVGLFELAHEGTIFLDEIDSTPENVQLRLLRVLQEKEVMRVGGDTRIPVDVRIIAAAGRDLADAVNERKFRPDLFYRINVLRVKIPSLQERPVDIEVLLRFFVDDFVSKTNSSPVSLPRPYIDQLVTYGWPGNIRQLKNFAERLVINCAFRNSEETLQELVTDLPESLEPAGAQTPPLPEAAHAVKPGPDEQNDEAKRILDALQRERFNRTRAARALSMSRSTLWRKMREYRIE